MATFLGIMFGWFEAAQHFTFRNSPQVLAINKVSPGIFWVAPAPHGRADRRRRRGAGPSRPLDPHLAFGRTRRAFELIRGRVRRCHPHEQDSQGRRRRAGTRRGVCRLAHPAPGRCRTVRQARPSPTMAAVALIWVLLSAWTWVEERRLAGTIPAPPAAPSVVLIVLDTVRADHLSLDGYPRNTTPNIDRWASEKNDLRERLVHVVVDVAGACLVVDWPAGLSARRQSQGTARRPSPCGTRGAGQSWVLDRCVHREQHLDQPRGTASTGGSSSSRCTPPTAMARGRCGDGSFSGRRERPADASLARAEERRASECRFVRMDSFGILGARSSPS